MLPLILEVALDVVSFVSGLGLMDHSHLLGLVVVDEKA